jgi:hypothetical protein
MPMKKANSEQIQLTEIRQEHAKVVVVGQSPLILNSIPRHVWELLLNPLAGKKTAAELAQRLKHDPLREFRLSATHAKWPDAPTEIVFPGVAFKKAMMSAALDIPGATKSRLGRLMYIEQDWVNIYGVPEMFITMVRSADMSRTPDVRTRAILPMWCATFDVHYVVPNLNSTVLSTLLSAAGIIQGVGDFRVEKGAGNYGRFRPASMDDEIVKMIMGTGGREAQRAAFENPEPYDDDSRELYEWFEEDVVRRGQSKMRIVA